MSKHTKHLLLLAAVVAVSLLWFEPAWADKLSDAIDGAVQAGKVKPDDPKGFLGIPGAPHVSPILSFAWAIWVGWIFSTVGAFGGVMAGVGHMTVFGLGGYVKTLGKDLPLNKMATDSIRASNQWLVGFSSLISSFNYYKMGRLVLPLALALGAGSLLGAWGSATFFAGKVSFSQYQGYFGLFVLVLGVYLFWETSPARQGFRRSGEEDQERRAGG